MKLYIITGTSSGIGRALALEILKDPTARVLGLSRRQNIEHERYRHQTLELSKIAELENLEFPISGNEEEIILVNNAGWIGEVAPLGQQDHLAIEESFNINLIAPTVLINQFLIQVKDLKMRRVVLNISSGAAQKPIASWSSYCASKAGLEMITRVIGEEYPELEVYAIAPGIVNTTMQQNIRESKPELFSDLERFKAYYNNGELSSAESVAEQILHLLNHTEKIPGKVFSLRNLTTN